MNNKKSIREDFPLFANRVKLGKPFVYLDSAATSQKPRTVIEAVTKFYEWHNANVHRGLYDLSQEATDLYEQARANVAQFIGSLDSREIIFTSNTSEAINLVAYGWAKQNLRVGDIIVTSVMEHHSNLVPWYRLREEKGVKIIFLPLTPDYRLDYTWLFDQKIDLARIKLVALTQASNVLGTVNPIAQIKHAYYDKGIRAHYLVDAAQSVPHMTLSVKSLGCDFLAFSSHKMLGPSGVGVLWAKKELLDSMKPMLVGSHMISKVTTEKAIWADVPDKFEVGTGRLEAVVGLSAAIDYLQEIGMHEVFHHELELTKYTLEKLKVIDGLKLYGPEDPTNRLGVFSFGFEKVHAHDIAEILNRSGVCIRAGHHCAQPLMTALGVPATTRASVYLYNDESDIDALCRELKEVRRVLKVG